MDEGGLAAGLAAAINRLPPRMSWAAAFAAAALAPLTLPANAQSCAPVVARLVSLQGVIEVQRAAASTWSPAAPDAALCPGDALRIGDRSRAALRLANQSTLRLDQNTTLVLSPGEPAGGAVELKRGAINVMTRTPRPFKVGTPFVNGGVDGTEFAVRVDADRAQIVVLDGRVRAANDAGALDVTDGQAVIASAGVPPRPVVIRPADAVQWALHYPGVIGTRASDPADVRAAESLARRGRVGDALARLDAAPADAGARRHAYRAELLLVVGRLDEARAEIALARRADASSADARAVEALTFVVRSDAAAALSIAREAVALDPTAPAAFVALSYAEQARFDIPAALAAAQQAVALAPDSALAHARAAELQLAGGRLHDAVDSAREAARLDPASARAQTVLGFAHLFGAETAAARIDFGAAIELDPADSLPRLGLGLALIRAGDLAAGREAIEIAAALDPLQALVRSYLGKAYHEERRGAKAAVQFELAKSLDPNDPTPWFYNAIRLQAENRPVEALREVERSIELNDQRAVSRSRLLLDQDRAARQVGLASIYADLASDREATALASRSLDADPSNDAAHRFLADTYAQRERHDVARTSELLQAQLLQPLGLNATSPELPFSDLGLPRSALRSTPFAYDLTSMFERDQLRGWVALLGGDHDTHGARSVVAATKGPFAASAGLFDFHTDGFRPDADLTHRIRNLFVQGALGPALTLQAEYRERRSNQGDLSQSFDPAASTPTLRRRIDEETTRIGAAWRPGPDTVWLASAFTTRRTIGETLSLDIADAAIGLGDRATVYELQLQHRRARWGVVAGLGRGWDEQSTSTAIDYTPGLGASCPAFVAPCSGEQRARVRQWNGYGYLYARPLPDLEATFGASHDHYDDASAAFIGRWNPKLGLRWQMTPALALRGATFSTVKRTNVIQQTLEPTQVAGFNQFYDAVDGTIGRVRALALDARPSASLALGAELGHQRSRTVFATIDEQVQRSGWLRLDATLRASSALVAAIGLDVEHFRWDAPTRFDSPTRLMTTRLPLTLRTFATNGYFAELVTTGVRQQVERSPVSTSATGRDTFAVVDASIGWRLPGGRGTVSLDVKNLFARSFRYQDDAFRNTEIQFASILPVRRWWLKASLAL